MLFNVTKYIEDLRKSETNIGNYMYICFWCITLMYYFVLLCVTADYFTLSNPRWFYSSSTLSYMYTKWFQWTLIIFCFFSNFRKFI
jgi:hypothetical protein